MRCVLPSLIKLKLEKFCPKKENDKIRQWIVNLFVIYSRGRTRLQFLSHANPD